MKNNMNPENTDKVVVRIPPSPTGNLNIGSARTALFNYIFAKKNNGKVVFRSEDTDKKRSKKEFEENILDGLDWLGIKFGDTIYRQSERTEIYKKHLEKMIDSDLAYVSKEEPDEEGKRSEVIRFRNTNEVITFTDLIRGEISFDTTELEDFVIAKSLEEPLYHLAVVVDDFEMGVTHIIRGEDGISNTPRQILIQRAIGAPQPKYAHLPLVLNKQRKKLSKRDGVKSISEYRDEGYFPEAIINYLALIGWNPGTDQEVFSMDELTLEFDFSGVQKAGAIYDEEKLNWFNKIYLQKIDDKTIAENIGEYIPEISSDMLHRMIPTLKERLNVYRDILIMKESGDLNYYINTPEYNIENLYWKKSANPSNAKIHLSFIIEKLKNINEIDSVETVKNLIWEYAEEKGKGDVLWPTRYALSGVDRSPDPFSLIYILGKDESISRLEKAVSMI